MKRRIGKAEKAAIARQMRNQGYADGAAGRPARSIDADYQRSWRRGREDLNARNGTDAA